MVKSAVYPSLDRDPKDPSNWVDEAGDLPKYIERIAKHLHYERGFTISHAIASAVNTVKRWARKGRVAKYGDPNNMHVTAVTQAQAAKAVAEWEAKKAMARARKGRRGTMGRRSVRLSEDRMLEVDLLDLAQRANTIQDPVARSDARMRIIDLALTKDGRKSFKGTGKRKAPYQFKHGFVPVTEAAVQAKAKGSPIARKRIVRLFGAPKATGNPTRTPSGTRAETWDKKDRVSGRGTDKQTVKNKAGGQTSANRAALLREAKIADAPKSRVKPETATSRTTEAARNPRATRSWDTIPEYAKTVRNGKRYVITSYRGKSQLTEWVGENAPVEGQNVLLRRRGAITTADAAAMTIAQLKRILEDSNQPASVRKMLNKILRQKLKAEGRE